MWVTMYVTEVKKFLLEHHGAKMIGGTEVDPAIEIPKGLYEIEIEGKRDFVAVTSDDRFQFYMEKDVHLLPKPTE